MTKEPRRARETIGGHRLGRRIVSDWIGQGCSRTLGANRGRWTFIPLSTKTDCEGTSAALCHHGCPDSISELLAGYGDPGHQLTS